LCSDSFHYTAVVFGQKRLTTLVNGQKNKKELLVKYVIRIAPVPRARRKQLRNREKEWSALEDDFRTFLVNDIA